MKNIGASVSEVLTREKKEAEVKKQLEEEEEYHQMRNEVVFFLLEAPEFRISAVGEWRENARGDIVQEEADTYFLHVMTGQRCESAWECLIGWSEPDEKSTEKWETLCSRIEKHENIEQTICNEKRVGL